MRLQISFKLGHVKQKVLPVFLHERYLKSYVFESHICCNNYQRSKRVKKSIIYMKKKYGKGFLSNVALDCSTKELLETDLRMYFSLSICPSFPSLLSFTKLSAVLSVWELHSNITRNNLKLIHSI